MGAVRYSKRVRMFLLAVVATVAIVSSAVYAAAAAAKPGITVQLAPASQSVTRGQGATYTVTLTSTGGFTGQVDLSAAGLPGGSTATFSPATVTLPLGGSSATSMTVSTTSSTPVGSSTLTVTGTSGKTSGSATAGLTVNASLSGSLAMTASPASTTMAPGSTGVYTLALTRTALTDPATFSVVSGLPAGATATFSPSSTTGNTTTLQVSTTPTTDEGSYTLALVASGQDATGAKRYAYANVQLVLTTPHRSFTISGNLQGLLAPGVSLPLGLTVDNPDKKQVSVTNLTVTIQSIKRTAAAQVANLPCDASDYVVTQYSGPYPLAVPGSSSRSLSQLAVPSSQWPQLKLVDKPTVNQDGCKGATVTLAYAGSGTGN